MRFGNEVRGQLTDPMDSDISTQNATITNTALL
jgi:hypothetical protein